MNATACKNLSFLKLLLMWFALSLFTEKMPSLLIYLYFGFIIINDNVVCKCYLSQNCPAEMVMVMTAFFFFFGITSIVFIARLDDSIERKCWECFLFSFCFGGLGRVLCLNPRAFPHLRK